MRLALLAMLLLVLSTPAAAAQAPKAAAGASTTTTTFTVTDLSGAPLADVHVTLTGTLDRSGSTGTNGILKFDGLRPGALVVGQWRTRPADVRRAWQLIRDAGRSPRFSR